MVPEDFAALFETGAFELRFDVAGSPSLDAAQKAMITGALGNRMTDDGVLVLQAWAETGAGPRFRGDVLAALAYGANWRLARSDGGYADLFAEPSPVVHFWSLAIEEQFYLAFPLVFAGAMALLGGARRRGAAIALFGAAALASFAVAWVSASRYGNDGLTYYGTHTRAGELLVGVVLAYAVLSPQARRAATSPAGEAAVRYGTPVAFVALRLRPPSSTVIEPSWT